MRTPTSNICPLRLIAGIGRFDSPAECIGSDCAWWSYPGCVVFGIVEELGSIAASLEAMEPQRKTPASAANADEGKKTQHDS